MKYYTISILFAVLLIKIDCSCQTIINGDFELNNSDNCKWNLSDLAFNDLMSNSWSIGNSSSGIDIQNDTCGYAYSPSNSWFVSISKYNYLNGSLDFEILSLEIDVNLISGNSYEVSYYDFASNYSGYTAIPLEIGLSEDSLSFGDLIFTTLPDVELWTLKQFVFVAPNNGKYLTIRNDSTGSINGWNFVDNFQISDITTINESKNSQKFALYPNPTQSLVKIESDINIDYIRILNLLGQNLISYKCNGASNYQFDLASFKTGIYIVEIISEDKKYFKKIKIL